MCYYWVLFLIYILSVVDIYAKEHILHASYAATVELFHDINNKFYETCGNDVVVDQSHGGSGMQSRSVQHGLPADVITLALPYDVEVLEQVIRLPDNWHNRWKCQSSPFHSVVVFVVKKGNPHNIYDWDDLVSNDLDIIMPNPHTSGLAQYIYMAAWDHHQSSAQNNFLEKMLSRVVVFDASSRTSTLSFVKRGMGDVLIAWEHEARFIDRKMSPGEYEIIYPKKSIRADVTISDVPSNILRHNNSQDVNKYIDFLYSKEAQEIMAEHYFRPCVTEIFNKYKFPEVQVIDMEHTGSWEQVRRKHFGTSGSFNAIMDKIYR